jgi:hypothetical protein
MARSFLLLEDDHDVDWEVGQDELASPPHPHRAALRRGGLARRPGAAAPHSHVCLSPVQRSGTRHARVRARPEQTSGGSARGPLADTLPCATPDRRSR